ncbi:MAG: T9SS type A sorting domain-containing protein, partial [Flavobacteriales bacterium]|nr:T9SS type A sorting domain-containing protein [Flavobacteriales bacterium]
DVKRSYFTGSNFYSYNRNNGYGKAYFIDNDITPFDDVYSVNVAGNENIQHPFVYQEAIIRDIILDQELMVTDYYLQNRTFDKDRDIECGGKMVVGSDVIPSKGYPFTGKKYLYDPAQYTSPNLNTTETEKSEKIAPVIVKSGYSLVLEAKDSIKLKPGFKAESGSTFKAIVDGTNPNTRSAKSEVRKCGRIISECKGKYSISNRDVSVNWILKGYNVHIEESGKSFSVPEKLSKGQYSLHATSAECPVASIVIVVEGKKEVYSSPESEYINIPDTGLFKIIPNPANESAKIVSWSKIGSYRITNSSGHLVLSNDVEFSLEHEINMSQFNTGVYLISVTYKNGEIETKSFVVQH